MATKTSILLFYLTLSRTQHIFKWASFATLAVVNLAGLALTFLNIFQCRPFDAAFKTPIPDSAKCEDIVTLYLSSAPVNIITDLAILFLPMPILTAIRLPRKQKTILVITFGFGFFVTVVDVIRIAYLQEAALNRLADTQNSNNNSGNLQRNNTDVSWYASLSYMWSAIEVNVGIMCACVPGLKPLVSRFLPNIIRDAGTRYNSTSADQMQSLDMSGAGSLPSQTSQRPSRRKKPDAAAGSGSTIEKEKGDDDNQMDIMDFLTTPDMTQVPQNMNRNPTAVTTATNHDPEPAFFDFVNMRGKKPMVQFTTRECIFPVTVVTILFFLWGIGYGFLDTLNGQFQKIAKMSSGQSVGIHSAYFAGYLVGPLTFGRLVLKHWGFKACFIIGLCVYGCGTLIFWPSAVLTSFPAFLISNFIVGLGFSTLEIAANPFAALCGPPQYAEIRLNLSQGVQAIGSVVSPLLASKVLFKSATDAPSLINTQWAYLGIALFCVILAVVYYYVPLPEASDADFSPMVPYNNSNSPLSIKCIPIIILTLGLGVLSQFAYVGAQEAISTTFAQFLDADSNAHMDTNKYLAIAHTTFAVARFIAAALNYFIKPRYLLLTFYTGAIILSIFAMNYTGDALVAIIMLLFFCEGPIFSLVYAMGLRNMGAHTKDAAAFMTAAIGGGAVLPPIQYAVSDSGNPAKYSHSYSVVVATFVFGAVFAVYCNVLPAARKQVDPVRRDEDLGHREDGSRSASNAGGVGMGENADRGSKVIDRLRRWKSGTEKPDDLPTRQHIERRSWNTDVP
jgi:fucose permease